jgi:S1-C subfamily serine protease
VSVYIFNDDYNVTGYPKTGGVIGNDILRRFNLIINYPSKEIHLKPNTHFYDDFDYSYTGLGLYQINGEIVVEDVIDKSPGDKAGFKQNDIIFAVDNNFTHSLQTYKQALQNAGNTIKVLVMRNGEPTILNLEIQHIMH